jgi:hypothetical protein
LELYNHLRRIDEEVCGLLSYEGVLKFALRKGCRKNRGRILLRKKGDLWLLLFGGMFACCLELNIYLYGEII